MSLLHRNLSFMLLVAFPKILSRTPKVMYLHVRFIYRTNTNIFTNGFTAGLHAVNVFFMQSLSLLSKKCPKGCAEAMQVQGTKAKVTKRTLLTISEIFSCSRDMTFTHSLLARVITFDSTNTWWIFTRVILSSCFHNQIIFTQEHAKHP